MNIIAFVGFFIAIAPDAAVTNQIFLNLSIFLVIYIKKLDFEFVSLWFKKMILILHFGNLHL